ncbi:MAG: type II toxin-antitoxin system VapC family toxin [Actinomycetota bacterium]|nr:type II toxin-antitoxin system VapC family toxin [Actinomycetota bacterium]
MIVLDTTVLVYATGSEHELRAPCRRLVRAVTDGTVRATTTVEVIQEYVHVRARRGSRSDAVEAGLRFGDLLAPLLLVGSGTLREGLSLFGFSRRLGSFDAILAAAALASGADALVSGDAAFAEVPGLTHVVPSAPTVEALLGG